MIELIWASDQRINIYWILIVKKYINYKIKSFY